MKEDDRTAAGKIPAAVFRVAIIPSTPSAALPTSADAM